MKFLPRKYREDSQDWFGKRGISWHVAVVFTKDDGILKGLTYLHIFDGQISQDASVTTAVILDVVKSLNQQYPLDITPIHLWSDNAGCYKSSETISTIYHHCKAVHLFDFCEAQDGKGACDRTAAVIKANIRRFVHEGHDVVTARDMKQAIEKTSKNVQYRMKLIGLETTERQKFKPIPSISTFNNFKFLVDRFWRHCGIGVGLKKGRLNRATKEKGKSTPPQDKHIIPVTACELDHSYVSDADGDKVQRVVREVSADVVGRRRKCKKSMACGKTCCRAWDTH